MGNVACIPEDVLDKASCWLERSDILSQRAVSRSARDAARRAIARKAIPDVRAIAFECQVFESESAHAMRAMGNVFGAGCTELRVDGTSTPIAALSSFVSATNGGLQKLWLYGTDVSTDSIVTMCLASPNLVDFAGVIGQVISDEAIATIARACPKLEYVYFSELGSTLGPAERWGRLFPRLEKLDLQRWMGPDGPVYRPTRLDAIAEAARITSATDFLVEGCHITPAVVEAVVGTPLGDRITKFGWTEGDGNETIIETDALFAAARGFPRLVHLTIPHGTTIADPDFYARLARIRTLESITIAERPGYHYNTDEHVVAACTHNRLEKLTLEFLRGLTRSVVDGIISSPSAATLRKIDLALSEPIYEAVVPDFMIRSIDILRLVRNLPSLIALNWQRTYFPARVGPRDFTAEREIYEVLVGRGGIFCHDVDTINE